MFVREGLQGRSAHRPSATAHLPHTVSDHAGGIPLCDNNLAREGRDILARDGKLMRVDS